MRGGERVLERLCADVPDAPIYTLLAASAARSRRRSSRTRSTPRSFSACRGRRAVYRWYLPLFPRAIADLARRGFDAVISLSHCRGQGDPHHARNLPPELRLHADAVHLGARAPVLPRRRVPVAGVELHPAHVRAAADLGRRDQRAAGRAWSRSRATSPERIAPPLRSRRGRRASTGLARALRRAVRPDSASGDVLPARGRVRAVQARRPRGRGLHAPRPAL